jgi:hypothetical protein
MLFVTDQNIRHLHRIEIYLHPISPATDHSVDTNINCIDVISMILCFPT